MRFENELDRTPEIVAYDRSRRFVMLAVAAILALFGSVVWFLSSQAQRYYFLAEGTVREAYGWGLRTPLILGASVVVVFLIVWYTPWLRPVRRKALQRKSKRIQRKQEKLEAKEKERRF